MPSGPPSVTDPFWSRAQCPALLVVVSQKPSRTGALGTPPGGRGR